MHALVAFASETTHTRTAAESLIEGLGEGGVPAQWCDVAELAPEAVVEADVLVLGTPVHMAGTSASMRAFFERTAPQWLAGQLSGKLGAAFVTAGLGGRGGAELTLISLHAFLAAHGFLLVPMPRGLPGFSEAGCHWGPIVETGLGAGTIREAAREALRAHGRHIAATAARWGPR